MYYVYAIRSERDGRIYVGITSDIERRVLQHNKGKTKSTKGYVPWKLIYAEEVIDRLKAREKEIYFKSGIG
ncbi:GIY-YIG nuclease family protein, partial [Parapedobacter deserti]